MKKQLVFIPMLVAVAIFVTQCFNKSQAPVQKATANPAMMTHKEAVDTLLADSTAPLKPLNFKELNAKEAMAFFQKNRLDSLFVEDKIERKLAFEVQCHIINVLRIFLYERLLRKIKLECL